MPEIPDGRFGRRAFLQRAAATGLAIGSGAWSAAAGAEPETPPAGLQQAVAASLVVSPDNDLNAVPTDYTGLSYETIQLSDPDYFSPDNRELVALFRRLSPSGVLRIGGNSSEFCWWQDSPTAQPPTVHTAGQGQTGNWMPQSFHAITPRAVDHLAAFLDATGWSLIYGLNFGTGSPERDAAEAAYVAKRVGSNLKSFQIGNEPDFYSQPNNRVRPAGWGFTEYLDEWTAIVNAVSARVPNARFGGPDVGSSSDWVVRFADAAPARVGGGRLQMLTGHYYAVGPPDSPRASIEHLLAPSPWINRRMERILPAARRAGLAYRMTEGNSCYRGGKPGLSNALAGALWGGDYMLQMASLGCHGVNFHGGGGSQISASLGDKLPGARNAADLETAKLGSFYSPIAGSSEAGFTARPIFYGMMLAEQFAGATLVGTQFDAGGVNATAYAARAADGGYRVVIFNKDAASDLDVAIQIGKPDAAAATARVWRLTGPALDATSGIRLAGAEVGHGASWRPSDEEHLSARQGKRTIHVPHASAALVFLPSQPGA